MKNKLAYFRGIAGLSQEGLARLVGTTNQQIGRLEASKRKLSPEWLERLAPALGIKPHELIYDAADERVRIVGHVGAGSEAHYYGESDMIDDDAPMPPGGTIDTVAVEIRGTSLGAMFDRWLVYYDDVRTPPTPNMFRRLCVVGLNDGRVLVKRIIPGSRPGHFHLESQTEGVIFDQPLEWAALVTAITPR